jgi:hypothetical protein
MNPILFEAVGVVTFALLFYSISVIQMQKNTFISKRTLTFLTAGIACDFSYTGLMIAGSKNIPITVHSFIGYSALTLMLIDTILMWRLWSKNRIRVKDGVINTDVNPNIPRNLHIYTRIAYSWWVVAYVAGAIMSVSLKR